MSSPSISAERLLADLEALAGIGGRPDRGVDRVAGSEADLEARRWLEGRMREDGLEARTDGILNVFGRVPGGSGPWLLLGSHTDTVPAGGRLDGAYGVVAALEALRTLHESGHPAAASIEVVSFFDEEGVVGGGGVRGSRFLCESPHIEEIRGYLELHIEQGPRLEAAGYDLAAVEGIVGIDRWDVTIRGAANHAGTTPMAMRRDAGVAAGRVLHGLPALLARIDTGMVGNIGEIRLLPGAANVVPGEARFVVEMRALEPDTLERAAAALRDEVGAASAAAGCEWEVAEHSRIPPAPMDARMVEAAERAFGALDARWTRLVSGAGHDAGPLSERVPAAMLFVPSRGGVSHSPLEHTDPDQLVLGCQALLLTALEVLGFPSG
jgi:N-carbamoyl-L-amino-acid hydrolase